MQNVKLEQEVINLSKEKWHWMSECKVEFPGRSLP